MADVEKVIEELKQLEHCITKSCDETCTYYEDDMYHCHYDVSVEETVENAIQTIRELQIKEEEVCEWKLFDEEANAYDTSCKNSFFLEVGSPEYNNMKYCPYCGRKIKVVE